MSQTSLLAYRQRLLDRYETASQREKLAIIAIMVMGLVALWDRGLHWPLQQERQALLGRLSVQQQEIQAAEQGLQFMQQQMGETPADKQRRLADLKLKLSEQQQQLQVNGLGLISPQQMASLLKQVLARSSAVELIRLQTLNPRPWSGENAEAEAIAGPLIYQHDLELELQGDYFSLLNYVKQIEQQAPSIYWDELDYQVQTWPQARLLLRVHTLSLEEAIIGA